MKPGRRKLSAAVPLVLGLVLLGGCASTEPEQSGQTPAPTDTSKPAEKSTEAQSEKKPVVPDIQAILDEGPVEDTGVSDPLEPANRVMFAVNEGLDTLLLQPVAYVYKEGVPDPIRDSIRNFLRWLREPIDLANNLMKGDWHHAGVSTKRFMINGVTLGIVEMAEGLGLPYRKQDFGLTLAHYGVGDGPYLHWPLIGPSNVRDTVGLVVDTFMNPLTYLGSSTDQLVVGITYRTASTVDFRAQNYNQFNDMRKNSLDFYATARTVYKQGRDSIIRGESIPKGLLGKSAPAGDDDNEFDSFVPGADIDETEKNAKSGG